MPTTRHLETTEEALLHRIRNAAGLRSSRSRSIEVRMGIGDDAAVLKLRKNCELAISVDASLEGVHFNPCLHTPQSIGYKALARAVSDLAAMGARPHSFLLSLAFPLRRGGQWLDFFLAGLKRASREFRIALLGGDTTRHSLILVQVTVIGILPPRGAVPRSKARPGDRIFVTGTLGAAELGLRLLPRWSGGPLIRPAQKHPLLTAQMFPRPPIELAERLARAGVPSAMMDISDGLSTDLFRLCTASRVGARIEEALLPAVQIPRIPPARSENTTELALHGGEDYGLLFTVPASRLRFLNHCIGRERITCIGEITRRQEICVAGKNHSVRRLRPKGWDSFRRGG